MIPPVNKCVSDTADGGAGGQVPVDHMQSCKNSQEWREFSWNPTCFLGTKIIWIYATQVNKLVSHAKRSEFCVKYKKTLITSDFSSISSSVLTKKNHKLPHISRNPQNLPNVLAEPHFTFCKSGAQVSKQKEHILPIKALLTKLVELASCYRNIWAVIGICLQTW